MKSKLLIIILYVIPVFIGISKADSSKGIITKICLKSFQEEMDKANKIPPQKMGEFTCECFYKNLNKGFSIPSSQSMCKIQAERKFKI